MNHDEELAIIKKRIQNNRFLSEIAKRYIHGFQTAILYTGEANAGKSIFAEINKYDLTMGMYNDKISMDHDYFTVLEIAEKIDSIYEKVVKNDEASNELSKNWNDKKNILWSLILNTQRIHKNVYMNCTPHYKDMTDIHLKRYQFLVVLENIIADKVDAKDKILDTYVIRRASIYQIKVSYVGNLRNVTDTSGFIRFVPFDRYFVPDYKIDPEYENFKKFLEKEYLPFEKSGKDRIAKQIQKDARSILDRELGKRLDISKLNKLQKEEITKTSSLENFLENSEY